MIAPGAALGVRLALVAASAVGGAMLATPVSRMGGRRVAWPVMALAGTLAGGVAALVSPVGWPAAANTALALSLVALTAVDLAALRLPDVITLPLCGAGLADAALLDGDVAGRAIGAAAGFLALAGLAAGFRRATGRSGLGLGDAKLLAAAGAWLGWALLPQMVLIACGLGFAQVALNVARRGMGALRSPFAFGPALCAALLIARLWLSTA